MIAVLDVLILDVKEQAGSYASLQASGWRDNAIVRLVATQSIVMSTVGAALGALAGLLVLHLLVGTSSTVLTIALGVGSAWVLAGAAVSLVPAWIAIHLNTARILAEEEI